MGVKLLIITGSPFYSGTYGELPCESAIQVHALTTMKYDRDVPTITWDSKNNKSVSQTSEKMDYISLWKGVTKRRAESMWFGDRRTGTFDIEDLRSSSPSDFAAKSSAQD